MTDTPLKPLSAKKRRFLAAYLETWNATRAAAEAGYALANHQAARLMRDPQIQAAIQQRLANLDMRADEVLARLAEQARVNISDFVIIRERESYEPEDPEDDHSDLIKVIRQELELNYPELQRRGHLIKEMGIGKFGPYIKVVDNQTALIQIGKHLKLFTEAVDVTSGGNPLPPAVVNVYIPDNGRGDGHSPAA